MAIIGRVLIVEDSHIIRRVIRDQIAKLGHEVFEAENGRIGLEEMRKVKPDCVILDLMMPEMSGTEVLAAMQKEPELTQIPVIVVTALSDMEKIVYCIDHGAADYMQKPFSPSILKSRLNACIERKKLHDREIELQRQLAEHNAMLEARVRAQVKQITAAQHGTIFAMCKLAESRDADTGKHLERVREFCGTLAERWILRHPGTLPDSFVEDIRVASPLHDIGKVAVPDALLKKPGKLTPEEFAEIQLHAAIGAQLLAEVARQHPGNTFLSMGVDIARSHHEKWDGSGYPSGLAGADIPLAARIVAVADVYDALTHQRCYKPAMPHAESAAFIEAGAGKHFDPELVEMFQESGDDFQRILHDMDQAPEAAAS